jgi:hypothetical protein
LPLWPCARLRVTVLNSYGVRFGGGESSEEFPHSPPTGRRAGILLPGSCMILLTYRQARSTFTADCWRCKSSPRTN